MRSGAQELVGGLEGVLRVVRRHCEDTDERMKDSGIGGAKGDSRCWGVEADSSEDLGIWDEGIRENGHRV